MPLDLELEALMRKRRHIDGKLEGDSTSKPFPINQAQVETPPNLNLADESPKNNELQSNVEAPQAAHQVEPSCLRSNDTTNETAVAINLSLESKVDIIKVETIATDDSEYEEIEIVEDSDEETDLEVVAEESDTEDVTVQDSESVEIEIEETEDERDKYEMKITVEELEEAEEVLSKFDEYENVMYEGANVYMYGKYGSAAISDDDDIVTIDNSDDVSIWTVSDSESYHEASRERDSWLGTRQKDGSQSNKTPKKLQTFASVNFPKKEANPLAEASDELKDIAWEKPSWTKKSVLKPSKKGEEIKKGQKLEREITHINAKMDAETASNIGWEKPDWAKGSVSLRATNGERTPIDAHLKSGRLAKDEKPEITRLEGLKQFTTKTTRDCKGSQSAISKKLLDNNCQSNKSESKDDASKRELRTTQMLVTLTTKPKHEQESALPSGESKKSKRKKTIRERIMGLKERRKQKKTKLKTKNVVTSASLVRKMVTKG